jgi:hypothetical protein
MKIQIDYEIDNHMVYDIISSIIFLSVAIGMCLVDVSIYIKIGLLILIGIGSFIFSHKHVQSKVVDKEEIVKDLNVEIDKLKSLIIEKDAVLNEKV